MEIEMSEVAAYRDRATGQYPVTLDTIRLRVPFLFGEEADATVLEAAGLDLVLRVDPPAFDPGTHISTEGVPEKVGDEWRQTWVVAPVPPPPVPAVVSMRQARLALLFAGHLTRAEEILAAMPGEEGQAARIEWEYATELRRDHRLVRQLGAQLGLDDAAKDDLFRAAAQIP